MTYYAFLAYPDYRFGPTIPIDAPDPDEAARRFLRSRLPKLPAFFFIMTRIGQELSKCNLYHARFSEGVLTLALVRVDGEDADAWLSIGTLTDNSQESPSKERNTP